MNQNMEILLLVTTTATLLGMPMSISASQPTDVAGDFEIIILGIPDFEQHENQCTITLPAKFTLDGDLQGSFESEFKINHLGNCFEPGPETFKTAGIFDGTVNSNAGTFDFTFQGTIDEDSIAQGKMTIQKGTGDLEGIHGIVELGGLSGVGGTYQGTVHFDP